MVRKATTLIELIFVIVIISYLVVGTLNLIGKIYKRNYIAKTSSDLEYFSQQLTDQLSLLLYSRMPLGTIGYNPENGDFKYIGEIEEDENYPIIEWIGEVAEAKQDLNLTGFADLYDSKKPNLKALDFNSNFINEVLKNKFNTDKNLTDLTAIGFAGTFDEGAEEVLLDYKNAFGWHGNEHKYLFTISNYKQENNNCYLSLEDTDGKRIYAKFYLADSAYALALGKDIIASKDVDCIKELNVSDKEFNNTLFLFYNYRPWEKETFCADPRDDGGSKEGNATVLAQNVDGFRFKQLDSHLEIFFTFTKTKADINVSVSKQKVVF